MLQLLGTRTAALEDVTMVIRSVATWMVVILLAGIIAACGSDSTPSAPSAPSAVGPLKIGLLLNFSDGPAGRADDRRKAFELAIKHVNDAGGVFGKPVEVVVGDSTLDPDIAAEEARRMIEDAGVHAIVGPSSSANTLVVVERVTGPAGIPTISPSATSPKLTTLADNDFLFRTALSDTSQGPVLARVTREQGFTNVGLVYRDDAWGQGLFESFQQAWTGPIESVAVTPDQITYLPQLQQTASAGAHALVVITFEAEAETIIREAIENNVYDKFVFGDASKSPDLVKAIGGDHLGGMYGTAGASAPDSPSYAAWADAYIGEYGELPTFAYAVETYDATIALALAAQAAGDVDGSAIRDRLRAIGSAPGEVVLAGSEGIASALRILSEAGEIDYEGASATLDWDDNGDLRRGHIGIWCFKEDETIEELETVPFEY